MSLGYGFWLCGPNKLDFDEILRNFCENIFILIFQELFKTFKKEKLKKVLNSSVQCLNKIEKDPKGPQPMEYCVTIATSAVQSTDFNSNRKSNENFYLDWFLRLGANTKWPTNSRKPDKKN